MPTSNDIFEITNPELLERIQGINNGTIKDIVISGQSTEIAAQVTDTLSGGELATIVEGNYEVPINDGSVNFMHYEGTGFVDSPTTSTTAIQKSVPAGPITQYNSNTTAIQRGRIVQPYGTSVNNGRVTLSSTPNFGSFGANAAYFLGEVNQAVAAASIGISLGKMIDSTLYNANPDYWDSIGMSSLNPDTWSSITHGDDSFGASLFNLVFGINPDTNKGQAYMDEQAYAYMALALKEAGWFAPVQEYIEPPEQSVINTVNNTDMKRYVNMIAAQISNWVIDGTCTCVYQGTSRLGFIRGGKYNFWFVNSPITARNNSWTVAVSDEPFTATFNNGTGGSTDSAGSISVTKDVNGSPVTYYYVSPYFTNGNRTYTSANVDNATSPAGPPIGSDAAWAIAFCIFNGTIVAPSSIDGVSNQSDATLPDVSTWTDVPSTMESLQNQYPDLWNDAIGYNQIQPDGTLKPTTYIPVGYPSTSANPWTDVKPTTDTQPTTQTQPQIDLDTWPNPEINPITRTLTQTPTPNPNPDTDVPQNPTDTGEGNTPVPTPPVGNASALWSVYHPTQAQVNSFGAWLWGSPFLTNIGKLFQNPIEGVISLHKVFATPVDSGSGTIVVGTLDSEVSSATVNQQYVEVDCGYVTLSEDFGNVFDYDPYTKVALYLPFVGIVPLNVADVMRSTINVKYGVDVFTGACIAMVSVSRDGNDAVLYQYSGNCAVHYPLSNVQQGQLLSGLITVAAGIGSIVATGGASTPAVAGIASGAASALHSNVGRSGGFSANAGAMGIKIPYLIIERPLTKVATTFPRLAGYPTNYSIKLGECSNHVVVKHVHVEGINATDAELKEIESLLKSGVLV